MRRSIDPFLILASLYVGLNLIAPIASTKISVIAGVTFATGSLLIGLSLGLLDVINDWKDKATARRVVLSTVAVRALFAFVLLPLVIALPASKMPEGFDAFLGQSTRLAFAGLVSLFIPMWYVNTPAFSWLKARMEGRWFVLRYLVISFPTFFTSNLIYGLLGFSFIAGVDLWAVIFGTLLMRMAVAVVISPVVWLVRWVVRDG